MALTVEGLFEQLHSKAAQLGLKAAKGGRGGANKGLSFSVESSCVEMYNEGIRDLYVAKKGRDAQSLTLGEGREEGWVVQAATVKSAPDARALVSHYEAGVANRDKKMMDLGSVHERSTCILRVKEAWR